MQRSGLKRGLRRVGAAGVTSCLVAATFSLVAGTLMIAAHPRAAGAESPIVFTIDPTADQKPISPLIYGLNGFANSTFAYNYPESGGYPALLAQTKATMVRIGGDFWTD